MTHAQIRRKLAAILHADVVGFSRLTAADEEDTYRRLGAYRTIIMDLISARRGRVVDHAGDSLLAEFGTATDALACSVYIQRWLSRRNADVPEAQQLRFRIGLNLGEVIDDRGTLAGTGVNVAARLQALAEPGGICLSDAVRAAVGSRLAVTLDDLGPCEMKNIPEPVHTWRVRAVADAPEASHRDAAVLRAEARAYAALMGDETETMTRAALDRSRAVIAATVERYGGEVAETPGDTLVAIFADAAGCVACARGAREAVARLNESLPVGERTHYRFGIASGEIREGADGVAGSAVGQAGDLACSALSDAIRVSEPLRERLASDDPAGVHVHDAPGTTLPPHLEGIEIPPPDRPSIAIIPFACLGGDAEGEALAEGLRIDITNALMKMAGIFLIAPSTMNHFRGVAADEVASRVGVRHVLEGSVRRAGNQVRVAMQLTDVSHGALVWSDRYDRMLDDTFALQDEITARVITELDVKLSVGEQARVWRKCLTHPKAREHFYHGLQAFFEGSAEQVALARERFERVADLVPESPVGPTWAALCLWLQATRSWTDDPAETQALATQWAERAAAMEDADGQAHTVLGNVRLLAGRYDEALAVARDSIVIRPGCNTANGFLANVLLHCGEHEGAITHAKRAVRIGPVCPSWFFEILSAAYREAGKVDLATGVAQEVVRLSPETVYGRVLLVTALVRGGWMAEAQRVGRDALKLEPRFSVRRYTAAQPYRSELVMARVAEELQEAGLPN